ncbi:hypothetical protein EAH78_18895 [Pseudomonas arsenicoxydans]|uniref:Uncharacterized protein n=1 Tax=Pseudomonas arsenicoxydans TaxID=702115 RepID=A0A502HNP0_9PSED|nr:hypothetical protein EAH78_18895 [Pseudomonas arsenicoxydans]
MNLCNTEGASVPSGRSQLNNRPVDTLTITEDIRTDFKTATAGATIAFAATTMVAGVVTQAQAADAAQVPCYDATTCKVLFTWR